MKRGCRECGGLIWHTHECSFNESKRVAMQIYSGTFCVLDTERTAEECPYPMPDQGPAQCKDGHWLGSPQHPIVSTKDATRTVEPEGEVPEFVYVGKWQSSTTHFDWIPSLRRTQPEDIEYRRVDACVWAGGRKSEGYQYKTGCGNITTVVDSYTYCGFCGGRTV